MTWGLSQSADRLRIRVIEAVSSLEGFSPAGRVGIAAQAVAKHEKTESGIIEGHLLYGFLYGLFDSMDARDVLDGLEAVSYVGGGSLTGVGRMWLGLGWPERVGNDPPERRKFIEMRLSHFRMEWEKAQFDGRWSHSDWGWDAAPERDTIGGLLEPDKTLLVEGPGGALDLLLPDLAASLQSGTWFLDAFSTVPYPTNVLWITDEERREAARRAVRRLFPQQKLHNSFRVASLPRDNLVRGVMGFIHRWYSRGVIIVDRTLDRNDPASPPTPKELEALERVCRREKCAPVLVRRDGTLESLRNERRRWLRVTLRGEPDLRRPWRHEFRLEAGGPDGTILRDVSLDEGAGYGVGTWDVTVGEPEGDAEIVNVGTHAE